jgi:ABC-type transporter Mla subunit MlaD
MSRYLIQNLSKLTYQQIKGDEDLEELVKHLNDHMDSIQGNIKQVNGIADALAKTKAAVQARLFNHLQTTQYEVLVLGNSH